MTMSSDGFESPPSSNSESYAWLRRSSAARFEPPLRRTGFGQGLARPRRWAALQTGLGPMTVKGLIYTSLASPTPALWFRAEPA